MAWDPYIVQHHDVEFDFVIVVKDGHRKAKKIPWNLESESSRMFATLSLAVVVAAGVGVWRAQVRFGDMGATQKLSRGT